MKSSVVVRIRVKGSKHDVTGRSKYSNQSYDTKFKHAILNAVYIDADNRHKKIRYDTKYDYTLKTHSIAYIGGKSKHVKKGVNKRLHNEIRIENEKRINKSKIEKNKERNLNKSISKKQYHKELYGNPKKNKTKGVKMQSRENKIRVLQERIKQEQKELKRLQKTNRDIKHKGRKH